MALVIVAYDVLEKAIVDTTECFLGDETCVPRTHEGLRYRHHLTTLNSSQRASIEWLLEMGVLTEDDRTCLKAVRELRNRLAHGFTKVVGRPGLLLECDEGFWEILFLLHKLHSLSVQPLIATDEDEPVDYGGSAVTISSSAVLFLAAAYHAAVGSATES
jgi:hypothetical protein